MAPSNVAHTTPLFIGFVPSLVCALVNHMLCCLCNKHTTCPFLLNNHHTTTSHWCCNHTTCCPNTHNTTTPPIIHQLAIVSPCPPPSHATACHTAALQQHTCLAICSCPHTTRSVSWLHHTQHNPAPQACASVGVCGALWLVSTHILFVLASPHHKHRVLAHQCATHTPTAPQHTQLGVVHHAMQPHHTHGCGGCVWCSGGCVGWLAQPPSLLVMPSMWCAAPVSSHHNLVPSSTHTLCHPHNNNNHCTVWCHLGNNHQPTNHANQPHSWRVVCGVVCCT